VIIIPVISWSALTINRFSKDLQVIDQNVALASARWLQSIIGAVTIVALISTITPAFLLVAFVLTVFYATVAVLYIKAARNLKRMEASQRGPLYQHFSEILNGAATIRAYGCEEYFIRTNYRNIDTHNRPYFSFLATTRWLGVRINFAGALVAFFATAFALINTKNLDPAAAGLSLSYALSFNETILW
jgi:ABC-type multidrug transport system fused ATPase/permease subunit